MKSEDIPPFIPSDASEPKSSKRPKLAPLFQELHAVERDSSGSLAQTCFEIETEVDPGPEEVLRVLTSELPQEMASSLPPSPGQGYPLVIRSVRIHLAASGPSNSSSLQKVLRISWTEDVSFCSSIPSIASIPPNKLFERCLLFRPL